MGKFIWVSLFLAGCVADDGSGDGPCVAPHGIYELTTRLRSGDCPDLGTRIEDVDLRVCGNGPGCSGARSCSADGCTLELRDYSCSDPGSTDRAIITGIFDIAPDGSRMEGLATIDIWLDGAFSCTGTYDWTWVKQ